MKRLFLFCVGSLVCLSARAGFVTVTSTKGITGEVELISVDLSRQTVVVRGRSNRQITTRLSAFDAESQALIRRFAHAAETVTDQPPAQWMSGTWGIGWRISAGNNRHAQRIKVNQLVEQVKTISGLSYVLFNLSQGASGDAYTAPHSVLSKVNPGSCSERDLFGELATAFQAAGYKVATDILQANGDIVGIFAINDPSGMGAYSAVAKAELTDQITIVAFDASPLGKQAVFDKKLYDTPQQFPRKMAVGTVQSFIEHLEGNEVQKTIFIPCAHYYYETSVNDQTREAEQW